MTKKPRTGHEWPPPVPDIDDAHCRFCGVIRDLVDGEWIYRQHYDDPGSSLEPACRPIDYDAEEEGYDYAP